MNPDKEWETWQGWLGREPTGDTIYAQVVEMLAFRQIWDAFVIVHDDAPTQARRTGRSSFGSSGTTLAHKG